MRRFAALHESTAATVAHIRSWHARGPRGAADPAHVQVSESVTLARCKLSEFPIAHTFALRSARQSGVARRREVKGEELRRAAGGAELDNERALRG